jgi:hypothetical protein
MGFSVFQGLDLGNVITHGVALQQVTVVKQQTVGSLGTRRLDQGDRPRQPVLVGGFVLVIVVAQQVHVHVGRLQDAQSYLGAVACTAQQQGDTARNRRPDQSGGFQQSFVHRQLL